MRDRADPWMSFYEPNYGRHGGWSIFQYTKDMHCSHDIITDCDSETESIAVRTSRMSIRGSDYNCSEDYVTFKAGGYYAFNDPVHMGGFQGFGDYGGSMLSPKVCGCIQYQSIIAKGSSCEFEPRFWHDQIQDDSVRERWRDAFLNPLTTLEDFVDLSSDTAIHFTANGNRLTIEFKSDHIRYGGDLQLSWSCVPKQGDWETSDVPITNSGK